MYKRQSRYYRSWPHEVVTKFDQLLRYLMDWRQRRLHFGEEVEAIVGAGTKAIHCCGMEALGGEKKELNMFCE